VVIFDRVRGPFALVTPGPYWGTMTGAGGTHGPVWKVDTARTANTNIRSIAGSMNLCSCVSHLASAAQLAAAAARLVL
jgi:hypothetical protein